LSTGRAARHASHGADLRLKLPVAVLQLLDLAGHLPELLLETLDPQNLIGRRLVLAGGLLAAPWLLSRALLALRLLAALRHRRLRALEQPVESPRRPAALLRGDSRGKAKCSGERCHREPAINGGHGETFCCPASLYHSGAIRTKV
jgi:hypothetical protein